MVKNVKDAKFKYLMYHRFLQIVLGKQTNDLTHKPINKLTSKLFTLMQSKYTRVHRLLLPAMLPSGNAAAGGQEPANANAPVDTAEGSSVAPDASASVAADDRPPSSPRPSTPRPPTPPPHLILLLLISM